MEKYSICKEIGSGSFGKVHLIENKKTGIQYVLKEIDLSKAEKRQASSASREVEVLALLKHPHIVRYKESFETGNCLRIIMEYCENGDLHKRIKEKRMKNELFDDDLIYSYFVQLCLAVEYIHGLKILHRDLKTKNIFLTKGDVVKLGDFGVAKVLENSFELANTCIGSPYYISPEICDNKPYNKKSDVWALGCVLYELSTLKYAFVAKNVKILLKKITTGAFNPLPASFNSQIRSLLINLLKPNPKDRPTVTEILDKPFLQRFRSRYSADKNLVNLTPRMRRARSGENVRHFGINEDKKLLSCSSSKLNELNKCCKNSSITTPEMKYSVPFYSSKIKNLKNHTLSSVTCSLASQPLSLDSSSKDGCHINNEEKTRCSSRRKNQENSKTLKLVKVDSEYYNLIAHNGDNSPNGESLPVNSAVSVKNSLCSQQKQLLIGCKNIGLSFDNEENRRKLDSEVENVGEEVVRNIGENESEDEVSERRRKWKTNTLNKKQLLSILGEAELIDVTSIRPPTVMCPGENILQLTVDDLLKLDPWEMSEDILQPVKMAETNPPSEASSVENYLIFLQQEITEIRDKFEANNRNYNIQDLMKLTRRSKSILKDGRNQKCLLDRNTGNESESVYFDLELKRMQLEKNVGLNLFLMAYRKMLDILNGVPSFHKNNEKIPISGSETYIIHKNESPDEMEISMENSWMTIIDSFGTKKEYIPDIWECAVRESVYY